MYTQNTPIHVKLWHRDFWLMAMANMLVATAMYSQFSLFPAWLDNFAGFSPLQTAVSLGISGLGIFSFGCFCSYWVQHYRRNRVCIRAILVITLCFCVLYYLHKINFRFEYSFILIVIVRFIQGAAFGVAQMVLSGTLIVDTCESFKRTEANHSSGWFYRLALSLGPALPAAMSSFVSFDVIIFTVILLCMISIACIMSVKFSFKAPEDMICKVSLDRFFLPQGKWLFLNLLMIATVIGFIFSIEHSLKFYGFLMFGFFLALLSQRFVFVNADLKSEVTTGLILILAALLINLSKDIEPPVYLSPVLIGCGIGIIGARFLLFFIKLRGHCQRSTSLNTFFLSWETGLFLGFFLGYGFFCENRYMTFAISAVLSCIALIMYITFTHNWYMRNKNR